MSKMKEIAPSILSAHRGYLLRDVNEAVEAGAKVLHIDVMDHSFVPNLGYDKATVAMLKEMTDAFLDVHLMMYHPERCVDEFIQAGADMVSVHVGSTPHIYGVIQRIKEADVKAGVAINPGTPLPLLEPILSQVDCVLLMAVNPGFGGQSFIPESVQRIEDLVETFRNYLNEIGDSLLVVADDEIVKVHVHTEEPGTVLNYGLKFGSLIKVKVDNMRKQNEEAAAKRSQELEKKPRVPYGVITVAAGEGVAELFRSMGANGVISGGQTMNPSTEDILKAIEDVNADNVIILPNNKNIFMAAEQAAEVSDIPAVVIPTRTISQGLAAMLGFSDQSTLDENKAQMMSDMENVKSGQVTVSIRDTEIDGLAIHENDYIGMIDNQIVIDNPNRKEAVLETLTKMLDEDSEIVTIIIGEEGSNKEAEEIALALEEIDDELEIEIHDGGQPVYPYLFSVE